MYSVARFYSLKFSNNTIPYKTFWKVAGTTLDQTGLCTGQCCTKLSAVLDNAAMDQTKLFMYEKVLHQMSAVPVWRFVKRMISQYSISSLDNPHPSGLLPLIQHNNLDMDPELARLDCFDNFHM